MTIGPRRERKVVTVLFCDLVGFTSQAESLDPEDVEAILRPYHERVRSELERHGGTVEKFIGDAVMALFGAPVAHEDDPERAVRAALAIREFAVAEGLELRVGVTTGEALVSLDARPEAGEGMASGDVVNTAARLQSAAPVNGILVDEATYRATRQAIGYAEAEPVEAKGKADPVAVWVATSARSRFGVDVTHHARTELVGRERELAFLRDAFERAFHERTPQLVTLVAVPGMGKSRLVYELSRIVDADAELVTWRQGRCLAYGDGVAFWALAEVVKAEAGIDERDSEGEAAIKLSAAVHAALAGDGDAGWVESHLRPLVGLETETGLGGDRRAEAFAAWRRYLEALADRRPLVLVLEDVHWADDGLLDFVDELVDWVSGVPLLVVCSARPELLERRPTWGGGKLNASTLGLSPLSQEQTALLLSHVLERSLLPAETQQALLDRAEGNPLYAEQFAQLYLERGSTDDLPLPETLQGIVAARLDGLSAEEKGVLQDAAVFGKVFWAGAVGDDEDAATALLHSLERKGFLARQRLSSVEGEGEWAFAHMLLRDVAYGQIPRAERATKHRAAAEWIEALGRPEDHAEMVAHHWRSALELATASGLHDAQLVERTRAALRDAGDRAAALHSHIHAVEAYSRAIELHDEGDADADLLLRYARALQQAGDERAAPVLEQARDALVAHDDAARAAEAEILLAEFWWYRGDEVQSAAHAEAAQRLIDHTEPTAIAARVLAFLARSKSLLGKEEEAIADASRVLAIADELHLDELRADALTTIGTVKALAGDPAGTLDLEHAVEIARAIPSPVAGRALNNLAVVFDASDGLRALEVQDECIAEATRFGAAEMVRFGRGNRVATLYALGGWDASLAEANAFIAQCEATGTTHALEGQVRLFRAIICLARDDASVRPLADVERAVMLARESGDITLRIPELVRAARVYTLMGRRAEAKALFDEALPYVAANNADSPWLVGEVANELGMEAEARAALGRGRAGIGNEAHHAMLQLDFERAAQLYADAHYATYEADARMRAGAQLLERGRAADSRLEFERALEFYLSVGATAFVRRIESIMADSQSASA